MDEMSIGDHGESRGARPEIDAGDAELGFVRGDDRQGARIGRGDETRYAEMAALHAEHQVAHGDFVGGDGVKIDG
jgi:hypothetical protein